MLKIKRKAFAKINLFLEVIAKREDGFNEICTIFSLIDLYDEMKFVLTKNNTIKILTDTDSLNNQENLVYKVAVFIKKKYNVKAGVEIYLKKNIPIAAGLGGGSSDAAQTILALNSLWELNLSFIEMNYIASLWGSDINFFLYETATAFGSGRGEIITKLEPVNLENIFLVNPGIAIPSSSAYRAIEFSYTPLDWKHFWKTKDLSLSFNRLEPAIRKKYPEINKIISHLKKEGAIQAVLSGSGATIIGFCPNRETAERLSQHYSRLKFWNTITKTKGEQNEHY